MSFCKSCGAAIEEGDKFCTRCGASVTAGENIPQPDWNPAPSEADAYKTEAQEAPQTPQTPSEGKKPFDKKIVIIIAVVILMLIGVTVGGILIMNNIRHKQIRKHRTINVNDYVEFEVEGYNGQGEASARIDYDDFYDAVMKAIGGDNASGAKKYIYRATAGDICKGIRLTVTPGDGLSNGDRVTVELDYDETAVKDAGIVLEFESYEEVIDGLDDVDTVDIFEYVELSFQGKSGSAWVSYENTATDRGLEDVRFTIDNNYNLSVGDEFTLTVSDYFVDMLFENYGIILKSTSKTYKVEKNNVDSYIESLPEVSEQLLENMKEYAEEEIEDTYRWDWDMELSDTEYMGMYLLVPNESNSYYGNYAFVIYKGTVTFDDADRNPVEVFLPVQVNNLIQKADQSQECDSWVSLWDDGMNDGDSECTGYLSEINMFLDIFNEENLLSFRYEISDGMRDYYDNPLEPEIPTEQETPERESKTPEYATEDETPEDVTDEIETDTAA